MIEIVVVIWLKNVIVTIIFFLVSSVKHQVQRKVRATRHLVEGGCPLSEKLSSLVREI